MKRAGQMLFLAILCMTGGTSPCHSEDIQLQDIHQAWRERMATIRSFEFEWDEVRVLAPGSIYDPQLWKDPDYADYKGGPIPQEQLTHRFRHKLIVDGNGMRYECKGPEHEALAGPGTFLERKDISVTDGTRAKSFRKFDKLDDVYPYPQGKIWGKSDNYYRNDVGLRPLLVFALLCVTTFCTFLREFSPL